MSINDLLDHGIIIEGKVKLYSWKDEEEKILLQSDDFQASPFNSNQEICYMFVGSDGYLHIEIEEED